MKKSIQKLNLNLDFTDENSLVEALGNILTDIREGHKNQVRKGVDYKYKFLVHAEHTLNEEVAEPETIEVQVSFEERDGQTFAIIPSKLNFEK